LGLAAPPDARIVAIDPHAGNDRGPREWTGTAQEGELDHELFHSNLDRFGLSHRVEHVREFSQQALDRVEGEANLLYIDGAHGFTPARRDLELWGRRVGYGDSMLVHDAFSSVGVTAALARVLFFNRGWRYIGRDSSLAEYRRVDLSRLEALRNTARQLAQLPWFARNIVVKLALLCRAWPVARAMGHRERHWPY
jgi:hypothetical protein